MYIWTSAEVEQILIELDAKKLPFKKYKFAQLGSGLSYLGRGGFSVVYEGRKRSQSQATYAIKVIGFGDKHVDSQFFRSSVRTQKVLGKLNECVITVYDYASFYVWLDEENHVSKVKKVYRWTKEPMDGNYLKLQFICMEKQDAVLYYDASGKKKLTPERLAVYEEQEVLKLGAMIGRALHHTHRRKVLHRDIKLENLFYDSRKKQYKLGDYGIAKVTVDGAASTVAFTKGYGAPEVVGSLDEKYDETADIYSLGMVLYVLMNDRKFPGSKDYFVNVSEQYQKGYVLERPSNGSDPLFAIVKKMCHYNPDERYQNMEEVLEGLEDLIFHSGANYKRKHKFAQLVVGIVSFALGVFILQNPNMQLEVFGRVLLLGKFDWLALTSISMSCFLLIHYGMLSTHHYYISKLNFRVRIVWFAMLLFYLLLIVVGWKLVQGEQFVEALHALFGEELMAKIMTIEFRKIGVAGLVFTVIWWIRELVLRLRLYVLIIPFPILVAVRFVYSFVTNVRKSIWRFK